MTDPVSWDDLYLLMDEVKSMARGLLSKEYNAESLQTTALVLTALRRQRHVDQDWSAVTWHNRQHFFGAMYRTMQLALIDHARKRMAYKRSQEYLTCAEDIDLFNIPRMLDREPAQVVALAEALAWLEQEKPQWVEVLKHRFYGGLTLNETARVMERSQKTVQRWSDRAQLVLRKKIESLLKEMDGAV